MKKTFLLLLGLCIVFAVKSQSIVTGVVFADENGNGKKERREKGLADVAVSNGREVVLTDANGRYSLPIGNDNPVFVIKPSGYTLPTDARNLPRFYYLHKPGGSPKLDYPGVAPTGKLPKSLDFALLPARETDNFRVLVFGDPQVRDEREVDYFRRGVIAEVEGIKEAAFGISLGDLAFNHLEILDPYIKAVSEVGIPWFNVMGNHDMNFDVASDSLSDETFEAHFGPANYAFNHGKVHFIVLDDILYPDPRDGNGYWGGFRPGQLAFIANDLKFVPEDFLVVLSFHIPLGAIREQDRQALFDLLKDFPYTLSLSAHTHRQRQDIFTRADGWMQDKPHHHYNVGTTSGSWYGGKLNEDGIPFSTMSDGTPKGYAFIQFEGNAYTTSYKVAGHPAEYQMHIFAPKVVAHNVKTSAGIYVNFFMGKDGDKVVYRVDNGPWERMKHVNEPDPAYLHLLHEWDFAEELMPGRRLPNAADCPHLWRGAIPTELSPGQHTIEVKATDMFGNTFTQKRTYRVEVPKTNH